MKRRKFLTLTSIIATSCSSVLFKKKETIICLDKNFPQNRIGSDGIGDYYSSKLNSGKEIALRINQYERNKYNPGDCFIIIPDKIRDIYQYEGKKIQVYKIIEKIKKEKK